MMKRKLLIGAFALVTALAATFAFESFSGQNEAKASTEDRDVKMGTKINSGCYWPGSYCIRKIVVTL
jgi:hypothetical protein